MLHVLMIILLVLMLLPLASFVLMLLLRVGPCAQNNYVETYGGALSYGATPGTYTGLTQIAGLKAIRGLPGTKVSNFEITRIDQASRVEQFAPSMQNPGLMQVTLGMFKTDYNTLLGMVGVMKAWKFVFSQSSSDAFDGFIEMLGPKSEGPKDEIVVDVDIRISGARTFTA
jgi:hypothetical protein